MRRNPEGETIHDPDGVWVNKISGVPVNRHHTKETAIRRGRQIARKRRTEHAIHNLMWSAELQPRSNKACVRRHGVSNISRLLLVPTMVPCGPLPFRLFSLPS